MSTERANRIANNTLFLYIRSFITMAIGIYSSRILLATLGIDDYGIYNLVGGVVAMFTSLKGIFASSVQRFLNYEKGKGNDERVNNVFNLSILIHVLLAIAFAILVECFGLWFINNKLTFPDGSLPDALFVFHCSVINSMLLIVTSPYTAVMIANERINVYAWIAVADSVLKLLIIYLLPLLLFHYLRSYATLILLIGAFNLLFSLWYCRRFAECSFAIFWEKKLFIELSSFAGWNFMGNTVFSLVSEGLNFMLNIFGGVAINAARGISNQVKGAVSILSTNLFVAVQPFVIQQAASQKKEVIFRYTYRISRFMFLIMLATVFPVIMFCDDILRVWLVKPPFMAAVFLQIMLVHLVQRSLHSPIDLLYKSFGDIKVYQILDSLSLALSLPFGYIALYCGLPLYSVFVVMCLVEVVNLVSILLYARRKLGLSILQYCRQVVSYCFYVILAFSALNLIVGHFIHPHNIFTLFAVLLFVYVSEPILAYLLLLNQQDKEFVLQYVKKLSNNWYINKIRF